MTPTPAPTRSAPPFEPLTQDDLSILTGNVQRPNGITWFNNNLYTACTGDGTVYEINSETGATVTYIWGINNVHTLYAETQGNALNLWVPDFGQNSLKRITRGGVETVVSDLSGPWGIVPLEDERFLVSNLLGGTISLLDREGGSEIVVDGLTSPTGLARDGETLYVGNNGSTRRAIEWYPLRNVVNADTDTLPENRVLVTGLQNTTGLQLASDGYLYFAYSLGTRGIVGRVDPLMCMENGGCTNEQVEIVVYTELQAPLAGLTITPDMRLFVHTMFSPDLYWARIDG
jgi:hypothetical protein